MITFVNVRNNEEIELEYNREQSNDDLSWLLWSRLHCQHQDILLMVEPGRDHPVWYEIMWHGDHPWMLRVFGNMIDVPRNVIEQYSGIYNLIKQMPRG